MGNWCYQTEMIFDECNRLVRCESGRVRVMRIREVRDKRGGWASWAVCEDGTVFRLGKRPSAGR